MDGPFDIKGELGVFFTASYFPLVLCNTYLIQTVLSVTEGLVADIKLCLDALALTYLEDNILYTKRLNKDTF